MLAERLIARHREAQPNAPLTVTIVDPFPAGAGRIWRDAQSSLLCLNSRIEDVTVFTDDSCRIDGPIAPGPSLLDWVRAARAGEFGALTDLDPVLRAELNGIDAGEFPSRRLHSRYLAWCIDEVTRRAGPGARIDCVRDRVIDVVPAPGPHVPPPAGAGTPSDRATRWRVDLASGTRLQADAVVLAVGHNGADARAQEEEFPGVESGATSGRPDHAVHIAPGFTADTDFDWIPTGEPVAVRGMGLAAIDLVILLTQGRGGRFVRRSDGSLRYLASGKEPRLYLGSRRGVPLRSKVAADIAGPPAELQVLDRELRRRVDAGDTIDYHGDVWPLITHELHRAHYRELVSAHPERVTVTAEELLGRLDSVGTDPLAVRRLAEQVVPDPRDRFDLAEFDRPLAQAHPATAAALQSLVLEHLRRDLADRAEPGRGESQALVATTLLINAALAAVPAQRWSAGSRRSGYPEGWHAFFSYLASGPPPNRLRELIALHREGIIRFLGPELIVEPLLDARGRTHRFRARSRAGGGAVTARILVDARLPEFSVATTDSTILRTLLRRGLIRDAALSAGALGRVDVDASGRVIGDGAAPVAGLFALGPFTSEPGGGAFTRPGTNALALRRTDAVAGGVLADTQTGSVPATRVDLARSA